jgi:hypothetical protein
VSVRNRQNAKRTFAVKGAFRYVWLYAAPRRERKVWFEERIARVEARNEREARNAAHRLFEESSCVARRPAPDLVSTSVIYLGIEGVLEFGAELEPDELWWELVDERPSVEERAPKAGKAPRRKKAAETGR